MSKKRVFLIVLDSFGIGEEPDAEAFGDVGANTIGSCSLSTSFVLPNLKKLGLFEIDGVKDCIRRARALAVREGRLTQAQADALWNPEDAETVKSADTLGSAETVGSAETMGSADTMGTVARLRERSMGKDTTIGHWEIAGIYSPRPLPTYPDGFPQEVLDRFSKAVGRGVLCNRPYSGTEVIKDYGDEHVKTGDLIVYTSADSVFQIAAHEDVVPVETLYEYCRIAREQLQGEHGVGRVIARPFIGANGQYTRTPRRHDFSLVPPETTMLDQLMEAGYDTLAIGKIKDIFTGKGISEFEYTSGNAEGIDKTLAYMDRDFEGICFVNLVDYDMLYGHRRDIEGYAKALAYFDGKLPGMLAKLREDDILMITADHGCDPGFLKTTDHTREYVPLLMAGPKIPGRNLGTRNTFADIGASVVDYFGLEQKITGSTVF